MDKIRSWSQMIVSLSVSVATPEFPGPTWEKESFDRLGPDAD